jgi:cation diffusion facilitator family transporter
MDPEQKKSDPGQDTPDPAEENRRRFREALDRKKAADHSHPHGDPEGRERRVSTPAAAPEGFAPVTDTGDSLITVVVAGLANLAIAVAKFVGAFISGSSAMLSEAAHSVADTVTEILLFVALRRGAKAPDARHPLGHGRETYLWALLASLATFVAGAVFSVLEGVDKIVHGEEVGSPTISYLVLAVAFVVEGISLTRALQQLRENARRFRVRPRAVLQNTTDTALKAVTFEDSAALVGLLLAAAGLALTGATGTAVWDGVASIAIGAMLVVVATSLARTNSALLVGRSAAPGLDQALRRELEATPSVLSVPVFVTTVLGPGQLLVAAKVEFADGATADDIERIADDAERRLLRRYPGVRHVFLDPTAT